MSIHLVMSVGLFACLWRYRVHSPVHQFGPSRSTGNRGKTTVPSVRQIGHLLSLVGQHHNGKVNNECSSRRDEPG
ncbi:hypothetical protein B0J18DRAFT_418948 [Chaetomium sp. MPI-SDFR-AT-0129]|nr:hypothetical protein B0J18DRAFT_418948 [Chaetomium sp. MPI-SDFR-AT-0129]